MKKILEVIKLSTLNKKDIIYVDNNSHVVSVEDVLEDKESYRNKALYTTHAHKASFRASDVLYTAIENESANMYEDWYENIIQDITPKDINQLQNILDRILSRSPSSNISYEPKFLIEFDV